MLKKVRVGMVLYPVRESLRADLKKVGKKKLTAPENGTANTEP